MVKKGQTPMSDFIEITEDEFKARFPLRPNHFNPNACWQIGHGPGCLFETYGEEFDFVCKQDPSTVWTLVDDGEGGESLMSGFHFVNRLGYLVSTVPVPEGTAIEVHFPTEGDEGEEH
jgi:hypothetical protein